MPGRCQVLYTAHKVNYTTRHFAAVVKRLKVQAVLQAGYGQDVQRDGASPRKPRRAGSHFCNGHGATPPHTASSQKVMKPATASKSSTAPVLESAPHSLFSKGDEARHREQVGHPPPAIPARPSTVIGRASSSSNAGLYARGTMTAAGPGCHTRRSVEGGVGRLR